MDAPIIAPVSTSIVRRERVIRRAGHPWCKADKPCSLARRCRLAVTCGCAAKTNLCRSAHAVLDNSIKTFQYLHVH